MTITGIHFSCRRLLRDHMSRGVSADSHDENGLIKKGCAGPLFPQTTGPALSLAAALLKLKQC